MVITHLLYYVFVLIVITHCIQVFHNNISKFKSNKKQKKKQKKKKKKKKETAGIIYKSYCTGKYKIRLLRKQSCSSVITDNDQS